MYIAPFKTRVYKVLWQIKINRSLLNIQDFLNEMETIDLACYAGLYKRAAERLHISLRQDLVNLDIL